MKGVGPPGDKSGLFKVFPGELGTAPMLEECPLCLECRVAQLVDLPTNLMVVGEIVAAHCEEHFLTQGQPDLAKIRPLLLSMPDNTYWTLGWPAGRAWSAGKQARRGDRAGQKTGPAPCGGRPSWGSGSG